MDWFGIFILMTCALVACDGVAAAPEKPMVGEIVSGDRRLPGTPPWTKEELNRLPEIAGYEKRIREELSGLPGTSGYGRIISEELRELYGLPRTPETIKEKLRKLHEYEISILQEAVKEELSGTSRTPGYGEIIREELGGSRRLPGTPGLSKEELRKLSGLRRTPDIIREELRGRQRPPGIIKEELRNLHEYKLSILRKLYEKELREFNGFRRTPDMIKEELSEFPGLPETPGMIEEELRKLHEYDSSILRKLYEKELRGLWVTPDIIEDELSGSEIPLYDERNIQEFESSILHKIYKKELNVTSSGRKFITAFLQNGISDPLPDRQILVTSVSAPARVSVRLEKYDFRREVTVEKGQTVVIPIIARTELRGTNKCTHPVKIEADADITVMSRNYKNNSGDTALIYPETQLGVKYYIITPPNGPKDQYKEFFVLSYDIGVAIYIYLKGSVTLNGTHYSKGDTITLHLGPFETFQFQSKEDLSGTIVTATYKIVVMAGHTCAQNNIGCSHVYEQLKPVDSWGSSYLVPGMSFQAKYDTVLVMASQNTSITYQSGTVNVTKEVAAGDLIQINLTLSSPLSIQSNHGIQVLLHGLGGTYGGEPFGSFLTLIQDTDSFGLGYSLIGEEKIDKNLGIIIAKTSSAPEIQFDDTSPDIVWKEFLGSEYSWAEYNFGSGFSTHIIQHPTDPFGLLSIGYSKNMAYGSLAPCFNGPSNLFEEEFWKLLFESPQRPFGYSELKKSVSETAEQINNPSGGLPEGTGETAGDLNNPLGGLPLQDGGTPIQNGFGSRRMNALGRYFVTLFMQNTNSDESPWWKIMVTGTKPSTLVTISIKTSDFKKDVIVGKGETVTIEIPQPIERKDTGLCPRGIIIKANEDITVMTSNFKKTSGDVALIYPVKEWGIKHYIITPYIGPSDQNTEFAVLAHEFPTTVTIILSGAVLFNGKYYKKGDTMTVDLKPFQLVQVQSKDDLSGTKVDSQYTVAVVSGHMCAPSNGGCSHVYEQLLPVESWGTSFLVPGLSFQSKSDLVYVLASKSTFLEYQLGGQKLKAKLEAGQLVTFNVSVSSPLSIHSNERFEVLYFGTGGKYQGTPFGSFLTKIPDIDSFDRTYTLIGQEDFDDNLAVIIAKTSSGPGIMYNGKALEDAKWKAFPQTKYSWSEYSYGGGSSFNMVQDPTSSFGLLTIGFSMNMAYGSVAPGIQDYGGPIPESYGLQDEDE